jgi:hypothetical protein
VSAVRLRVVMIALLVAGAVFSGFAGDGVGPFFVLAFVCFTAAVAVFLRWRRKLRGTVFDREEKTVE